jgi:hypothetical protein
MPMFASDRGTHIAVRLFADFGIKGALATS